MKKRRLKKMVSVEIRAVFTYDEELMYGVGDEEARDWFFNDILQGEELLVHSNEIGDTIGTMRVKEVG